jgi:hypothetical protein
VASIILKWKFGTTKSLPRAGWPEKLSNQGIRALVKNPMVSLTKYSKTMRNKTLWSDETKIELFGLNTKRQV